MTEWRAKDLRLRPVPSRAARRFVRRHHYSGRVVNNSWLHLGAFLGDRMVGALQFGPSMRKDLTIHLVRDTAWDGYLELNRMVFTDEAPRNSESRALAVAARLIRRHYPQVEWILTFADACQCGDGTIYRAAGFLLLRVQENRAMARDRRTGEVRARKALTNIGVRARGESWEDLMRDGHLEVLEGHQVKYLLPLNDTVQDRLTVDPLPYSALDQAGARMYRGRRPQDAQEASG